MISKILSTPNDPTLYVDGAANMCCWWSPLSITQLQPQLLLFFKVYKPWFVELAMRSNICCCLVISMSAAILLFGSKSSNIQFMGAHCCILVSVVIFWDVCVMGTLLSKNDGTSDVVTCSSYVINDMFDILSVVQCSTIGWSLSMFLGTFATYDGWYDALSLMKPFSRLFSKLLQLLLSLLLLSL